MSALDPKQQGFVDQAIRRQQVFLYLSGVGVLIGLILLVLAGIRALGDEAASGTFIVGILVLLNARQNLRQHKYAKALRDAGVGSVELEASDDR